eukprot:TRINITY_DN4232_c0_g1_i3.p1 TRINITY_DN4232_c0_g1~~TRINITY_DN4232_c0_g1_i3.p1  ORF type:complete len:1751 (+),score=264.52 TRINITY_DN4232_c0_g1_i3:23-5254(+)
MRNRSLHPFIASGFFTAVFSSKGLHLGETFLVMDEAVRHLASTGRLFPVSSTPTFKEVRGIFQALIPTWVDQRHREEMIILLEELITATQQKKDQANKASALAQNFDAVVIAPHRTPPAVTDQFRTFVSAISSSLTSAVGSFQTQDRPIQALVCDDTPVVEAPARRKRKVKPVEKTDEALDTPVETVAEGIAKVPESAESRVDTEPLKKPTVPQAGQCMGWLLRLKDTKWATRWVRMVGDTVDSFVLEGDSEPEESFTLAQIAELPEAKNGFAFVSVDGTRYAFRAETSLLRRQWVEAGQRVVRSPLAVHHWGCMQEWPAGNPPNRRSGHSICLVSEFAFVFGGRGSHYCNNDVTQLHLGPNVWQPVNTAHSALPPPRCHHTAVILTGRTTVMCIFGGEDFQGNPLGDMFYLELDLLRWKQIQAGGDKPAVRTQHTACVYANKMYVFGGIGPVATRQLSVPSARRGEVELRNDVLAFDPISSQWTTLIPNPLSPRVPVPRRGHACSVSRTRMYIYGGMNTQNMWLNSLYAFDFESLMWYRFNTQGDAVPPLVGHTMLSHNDHLFICGAAAQADATGLFALKLRPESFTAFATELPTQNKPPPLLASATFAFDDVLYQVGGISRGKQVADIYCISLADLSRTPVEEQFDSEVELVEFPPSDEDIPASPVRKRAPAQDSHKPETVPEATSTSPPKAAPEPERKDKDKDTESLISQADEVIRQGHPATGMELLQLAAKRSPFDPRIRYNMACCAALMNKPADALGHLSKAVEYGFNSLRSLEEDPDLDTVREHPDFDRLKEQLYKQTMAVPERSVSDLSTRECDKIDELMLKAEMQIRQKDLDCALALLMQAKAICPRHPFVLYNMGCVFALKGDRPKAIDAVTAAVENGFSDSQALNEDEDLESVRNTLEWKELKRKVAERTMATRGSTSEKQQKPAQPAIVEEQMDAVQQAKLMIQKNQLHEALELLSRLEVSAPSQLVYFYCACVYALQGKDQKALSYLGTAILSSKSGMVSTADLFREPALAAIRDSEEFSQLATELAEKERATKLESLTAAASSFLRQRRTAELYDALLDMELLDPYNPSVHAWLAFWYSVSNMPTESSTSVLRAVHLNVTAMHVQNAFIEFTDALMDNDGASSRLCHTNQHFYEALAKQVDLLVRSAIAAIRNGRYPDAEKQLLAALQADPNSPLAHYNLACLYALTGNKKKALAEISRVADAGGLTVADLDAESDFSRLRSDPQYIAIRNSLISREAAPPLVAAVHGVKARSNSASSGSSRLNNRSSSSPCHSPIPEEALGAMPTLALEPRQRQEVGVVGLLDKWQDANSVYSMCLCDGTLLTGGSTLKAWPLVAPQRGCVTLQPANDADLFWSLDALSSNAGNFVVSGELDGIRLWSLTTMDVRRRFQGHFGYVFAVRWMNDETFASGGRDNTVRLWDVSTGKCLNSLTEHVAPIYCLLRREQNFVISGSKDNTIKGWDLRMGAAAWSLSGHGLGVWSLTSLLDRYMVSGGGDGCMCVWDLERPTTPMYTYGRHTDRVLGMTGMANDRAMASVSKDSTVQLWLCDANTGALQLLREPLTQHEGWVKAVVGGTHPESRQEMLFTAGQDHSVRVWTVNKQHTSIKDAYSRETAASQALAAARRKERLLWDWKDKYYTEAVGVGIEEGLKLIANRGTKAATVTRANPDIATQKQIDTLLRQVSDLKSRLEQQSEHHAEQLATISEKHSTVCAKNLQLEAKLREHKPTPNHG